MMTNNGGFQSNYNSGPGGIYYQHAQTYSPPQPGNYNPQYPPQHPPQYPPPRQNYPPQHQPNYPPQYPPQQPQNYGRANTYMPPVPSPNNYPPQQPYPPQYPPSYGHANTYAPPQAPIGNYPPNPYANQPAPVSPPIISVGTAPYNPAPIIRAQTAPMPIAGGFAPYPTNFNPETDCQILHNAVHGFGTDERAIINIIVNRNYAQRAEIRRCYKASYGKDLIKRLKEDTSGNFKDVVAGMFMTPPEYDATCLYKAMKGLGTNEGVLIEIIGTRTPPQLVAIKQTFRQLYNEDLEKWVKDDTSGNFRKLLIAILQCNRSMNPTPDPMMCQADAQALYNAGEGRWGTDESTFIRIFANRSAAEMLMINDCYTRLRGKGLLHAIDKEFSGDIKKLLQTVVEGLTNAPAYFAKRIREAVKGLGTNDSKLVRVIVSRSEIDLGLIKQEYRTKYGRDMLYDVRDDTSGYYKEILTGLIARC